MILEDFCIPELANLVCNQSGVDTLKECKDPTHFKQYPWPVEYCYNSRGFRDAEWPESIEELKDAVWVVGDSVTVGIGAPLAHTWPFVLSQRTGRRVINVSMEGASNDWISRRAQQIIDQISPRAVVMIWSYLHRTESNNQELSDIARRCHYSSVDPWDHLKNFEQCVDRLKNKNIHWCIVPQHFNYEFGDSVKMYQDIGDPSWPSAPRCWDEFDQLPDHVQKELKKDLSWDLFKLTLEFQTIALRLGPPVVDNIQVIDRARDGHHFDIKTAQWLAQEIQIAIASDLT
jgi:hypothetical protein